MDSADRTPSTSLDALTRTLSRNLRRHAEAFRSISELCRACDVNRQQFNKYLSGDSLPSLLTLVKISNVLDVNLDELLGYNNKILPKDLSISELFNQEKFPSHINIQTGYYNDYALANVFMNRIIVGVSRITESSKGGEFFYRRKLTFKIPYLQKMVYWNYYGRAYPSENSIFIIYANTTVADDFTSLVLKPDTVYNSDLSGIKSSSTTSTNSVPYASPLHMEYLGQQPDLRAALRRCGALTREELDDGQKTVFDRLSAKVTLQGHFMRVGDE